MPDLLIPDVDDVLVRLLEQRAARHGRSAEAEYRAILQEALQRDKTALLEKAARLRAQTAGRDRTDGADLIRAERERATFAAKAEWLVAELRERKVTDSAEMIRAYRDRDGAVP
jgi:plasmid stability protein